MSNTHRFVTSRREFLQRAGGFAVASALAATAIPHVHASENNTIQVALVGCGGRGTGAAANASRPRTVRSSSWPWPTSLRQAGRQSRKPAAAVRRAGGCARGARFIGFDAYKRAIDCLNPGDVVIFASYPAFRWVHFTYAIQKGVNVFMEKPVTVDGPTTRRMLALAEESVKKNLKVAVGLMIRHCRGRQQLLERIRSGEIGDILTMRAYRMSGPISTFLSEPKPDGISELLYQIQRSVSFLWASARKLLERVHAVGSLDDFQLDAFEREDDKLTHRRRVVHDKTSEFRHRPP